MSDSKELTNAELVEWVEGLISALDLAGITRAQGDEHIEPTYLAALKARLTHEPPAEREQFNPPWRAEGFAIYDRSNNLVVHVGITGNRSFSGEKLERMAQMIVDVVNRAAPPPAEGLQRAAENLLDVLDATLVGAADTGYSIRAENVVPLKSHVRALLTTLTKRVGCVKCGSTPLATERGRCEECGAYQSSEGERNDA